MTPIAFEPDLSTCVEALAKGEYHRTLRTVMQAIHERTDLDDRLETLRLFLEQTDFAALRSRYEPHLVAGRRVRITVRSSGDEIEHDLEVEGFDR